MQIIPGQDGSPFQFEYRFLQFQSFRFFEFHLAMRSYTLPAFFEAGFHEVDNSFIDSITFGLGEIEDVEVNRDCLSSAIL
jgi:hypothetical protein